MTGYWGVGVLSVLLAQDPSQAELGPLPLMWPRVATAHTPHTPYPCILFVKIKHL